MFNPQMYLRMMLGQQGRQQQGGELQQQAGQDTIGGQQGLGGGLFGNPLFQAAGLGFGSSLLGGLADMFAGETEQEKRSKQMYNLGMSELQSNRDVINPMATAQRSWSAALPMINKHAGAIGRRMNLDSGQAQGALAESMYPQFMQTYADASQTNDLEKARRRQGMFQSMMSGYGGY